MNRKLSVIVPAYRESPSIRKNLISLDESLKQLKRPYEIVVVCDGCIETFEAAKELTSDYLKLYYYEQNMGKGYALKYGVDRVLGELVTFIDADMSINPTQIDNFIKLMDESDADIVIGSKRHPQSQVDYPPFRWLQSFIYQMLVALLFRISVKDSQTGLKLFRRDVLMHVMPRVLVKAYAFDLELLVVAHHLGYRKVVEAPIIIKHQLSTTTSLRAAWNVLMDTLAIFYRLHILKFYDRDHIFLDIEGKKLKTSIIVPVRAAAEASDFLRQSYAGLNYDDYEILVVGDEPGQNSPPSGRFRYLSFGRISPTEKRDLAVDCAEGDILAFIDDDAAPRPDWLINAVRHFHTDRVAAVSGPAITATGSSVRQIAGGAVYESRWGSGSLFYRFVPRVPRELKDVHMVNFLVRKDVFKRVGRFNTETWPGEGRILCAAINKEGLKIVYDPDVIVFHKRRPLFLPHLRQITELAFNQGALSRRQPGYFNDVMMLLPSLLITGLLLGPIAGLIGGYPLIVFAVLEGAYLTGLLTTGIWTGLVKQSISIGAMVIPGIMATQLVYGASFIQGFLSGKAA